MDFDDTPEEAAFRAEAIGFLDANAPSVGSTGGDAGYFGMSKEEEAEHVERCQVWQQVKYDNGWAGLTWPTAFGGRGLSGIFDGIFKEEESKRTSATGTFAVSIGMVGPTIIAHGTDAQRERYLPPILRGEEIWCQLFSEPAAGSDLGALRTTAVRDGDEYVVNGQKVWTSGAHNSHWGILLTRTDWDANKHRGITYFLVDMSTPGIDVRPLRQLTGAAHFNEVFLDDVRIPVDNVLGDINGGWGPIMTTLANERALIGGGGARQPFSSIIDLARMHGRHTDPAWRQEMVRAYTRAELMRYLGFRVRTAASKGELPGPESSILKLFLSQHLGATGDLVVGLCGAAGMLADAPDGGLWQDTFLSQWGARIGGGTDEIQRNTIGEKVLRLPPEPRLDKGIPFKDIPA